jgi:hypothetical protein
VFTQQRGFHTEFGSKPPAKMPIYSCYTLCSNAGCIDKRKSLSKQPFADTNVSDVLAAFICSKKKIQQDRLLNN